MFFRKQKFDVKQLKIYKFISNVKQLKINKFIEYIWQLIISTSNATIELPSLLPWAYIIKSLLSKVSVERIMKSVYFAYKEAVKVSLRESKSI